MKITLEQMLPSNDLFTVMKENAVDMCQYYRWNHVSWGNKLVVGDKLVSQGPGDKKFDGQKMFGFRKVNPETGEMDKTWYGIKECDLRNMLEDETLDYNGQFVSPSGKWE